MELTLNEWVERSGSYLNAETALLGPNGYRGLVAPQNIKKGTKLGHIGADLLVNKVSVQRDADLAKDPDEDLNPTAVLANFLATDKSAKWAPFIESLPPMDDFKFMPLSWVSSTDPSFTELCSLLPQQVSEHAKEQYKTLLEHWQSVDEEYPFKDFLLCWLRVNTRCLHYPFLNEKLTQDQITMVPLLDFINHSPQNNCEAKPLASGFDLVAVDDIARGNELLFNYGPHDALFLLCEYGFAIPTQYDYLDLTYIVKALLRSNEKYSGISTWLAENGYDTFCLEFNGQRSYTLDILLTALVLPEPLQANTIHPVLQKAVYGEGIPKQYDIARTKVCNKLVNKVWNEMQSKLDSLESLKISSNEGIYNGVQMAWDVLRRILEAYQDKYPSSK